MDDIKKLFKRLTDRATEWRFWEHRRFVDRAKTDAYNAEHVGELVTELSEQDRELLKNLKPQDIDKKEHFGYWDHVRPKEPIKRKRKSIYTFKD